MTLLNIDQINRILWVRKQQMKQVVDQMDQKILVAAQSHIERFYAKCPVKEWSKLY